MKRLLAISLGIVLATSLRAFDSAAWMNRRAAMTEDAKRLEAMYREYAAKIDAPAEELTVPIEDTETGERKALVTAAKAQFFDDGKVIWGEDVVIEEKGPETGRPKGRIHARHILVDRDRRTGWADGHTVIDYGATRVEGDGIYFSFSEEFVKILSKVEITSSDLKFEGAKL